MRKEVKQMNGPLNRKKHVSGTASQSSMKVSGEGRKEGPVGAADGYQQRKAQQSASAPQRSAAAGTGPMARPKTQPGQASGSMHTGASGFNAARPQQTRPNSASQGANPYAARPQQTQQTQQTRPQTFSATSSSQSTQTRGKSGFSPLILILLAVVLLGGGGGLSGLFGGGSDQQADLSAADNTVNSYSSVTDQQTGGESLLNALLGSTAPTEAPAVSSNQSAHSGTFGTTAGSSTSASADASSGSSLLQQLLGGSWYASQTGYSAPSAASSVSTSSAPISGTLNRTVAPGSRSKYTSILGSGRDKVTIMVYMCGADLESRSAMATKDLQEMLKASFGSNVRLIIFTGGSTSWRNNMVSSSVNQIWQVVGGQLKCLEQNAGTASMTSPDNLASFIRYCAQNFPANRYDLILWNHGSGTVSGYGYDEKNPRSGSMSLAGLNTAFQNGGVKFDFIGFDACLMATVENALMASKYADYLIASEETEPGIGWYYTDWLTALGKNSSLSTLDIGKQICDDFVSHCASECRGQQTTLSVIDLAELENTVPAKLSAFSRSVSSMISNQEYRAVSNARNGSREFAVSSRIDQVDLTDLCNNLGTQESAALAEVLRAAVKYNKINNISNAYGVSAYFPYQRVSNVDKAIKTYEAIGMDASYAQCIRDFAGVEASGQAVTGGTHTAAPSLFGSSSGSASPSSGDMIGQLLSAFLGGGYSDISGLSDANAGFLSGRSLSDDALAEYLTANILDASALVFQQSGDNWVLDLPAEQWALVHGVDLNVFYDNGAGYVDLGLDNLFEFDEAGRLVADLSGTWLAINGQPVPYYHETSEYFSDTDWRISGRVPVLLNGSRAELLLVFDAEHEAGYVAGARAVYTAEETETVAKAMTEIVPGDTIVFLADLYDYDQNFIDSYSFGDAITVGDTLTVSDVYLPDPSCVYPTYRITDLYNQAYWTGIVGR